MNLSGTWKGTYTYGLGYSKTYIGKSEPFEFELIDNDGAISGSCIDHLVELKEGNESHIVGRFQQKDISFKKRYKFEFAIDEYGNLVLDDKVRTDGVDYTGKIYRSFFGRKVYFKGEWCIKGEVKDEDNVAHSFVCKGKWKMIRY